MKNKVKYLKLNLTKEVRNLYADNYNTLIKATEDDSKSGKLPHALGMEVLGLFKKSYHPKETTDFMQSLSKYP